MNDNRKFRVYPYIHNAEELGIAVLGRRFVEFVPRVAPIDRAARGPREACFVGWGYGRALARLQGGIFSSKGYIVPYKDGVDYDFQ